MDASAGPRAHSFRDPAGRVYRAGDRVVRVVDPDAAAELLGWMQLPVARRATEHGAVVRSRFLGDDDSADLFGTRPKGVVVEHERVPFASYPHEWTPAMLHAAGRLTLDLARASLPHAVGLKDATPSNVLFRGTAPVFVDVLSFERRDPCDPTWLAAAQFERNFVLPLLAHRSLGLDLGEIFVRHRDGLAPERLYRMLGRVRRLSPSLLAPVTLPVWLRRLSESRGEGLYIPRRMADPERARFVLGHLLDALRRRLDRVVGGGGRSAWTGYDTSNSYAENQVRSKGTFVGDALRETRPATVLDVGCNTGRYGLQAARLGARVVAIDSDAKVVDRLFREARREKLDVLPLVVDLARPTAPLGWRNRETDSFLSRAAGGFDAVLMLAVVHHLLVTERIPLAEIVDLAAELTKDLLVIEYVGPGDPMFRRIARGREALHADLTPERFEAEIGRRFEIEGCHALAGSERRLYRLRRRQRG